MTTDNHPSGKRRRIRWKRWFWTFVAFLLLIVQQRSAIHPDDWFPQQAGVFIAGRYFDFVGWELNAAWLKVAQAVTHTHWQLDDTQRQHLVLDYIDLLRQIHDLENRVRQQYATLTNPALTEAVAPMEEERKSIAHCSLRITQREVLWLLRRRRFGSVWPEEGRIFEDFTSRKMGSW